MRLSVHFGTKMKVISLVSSDQKCFCLYHHEATCSGLLRNAIEEEYEEDEDEAESDEDDDGSGTKGGNPECICNVPLANVSSEVLTHVIEFLKHHAIEPLLPLEATGESFRDQITQDYYFNFIEEKTNDMIFKLSNAANYLDIEPLFNLTVLKVSFDLMDKSAEEIREFLNLPKLSPEEEEKARQEHPWIFEE